MNYTETTTTSWFARLKNALIRIVVGFIVLIAAAYVLFWNEGRAIGTYRALAEGAGLVTSVESGAVDPANEGKLIHISGPVKPVGTPEDRLFGISAAGAIQVSRQVEMYQWVEEQESKTEKKLGGGEETVTTYRYTKQWRSDVVNSDHFRQPDGHRNPDRLLDSEVFAVDRATLGAFTLKGQDVPVLGSSSPIALDAGEIDRFRAAFGTARKVTPEAGRLYIGNNGASPEVGDLRVSYQRVDITDASFVGAQRADGLTDYKASNGRAIFLSAPGIVSATELFQTAQTENTIVTWAIRVGGLFGLFIGFGLVFSILGVIADVIPLVGSIVRFGTSALAAILTLLIGPVIIAIGWFAYRPLLAFSIVLGGVAIAIAVSYLRRRTPAPGPFGRQPG